MSGPLTDGEEDVQVTGGTPEDRELEFVDRYLSFLTGGDDEPELDALEEPLRNRALQQLRALDLLVESDSYPMPPIEDDPIAKRFGFDRREPTLTMSVAALKDAARGAGIQFSELARRLTASGRQMGPKDLLRLTNGVTIEIDRDLAARLAAILNVSVSDLEAAGPDPRSMTLDEYLVLDEARAVIDECARELGLSFEAVEQHARDLVVSAAFRNRTDAAWRDALLGALNRIRDEHR